MELSTAWTFFIYDKVLRENFSKHDAASKTTPCWKAWSGTVWLYISNEFVLLQGILDASRQRHNILWRSKSETNLKSASGQASRPKMSQGEQQQARSTGSGSGRRKESVHKSTEELAMGDPTYSHHSCLPTPASLPTQDSRRPKSWSPDEHTADLHFPQKPNEGTFEKHHLLS